MFITNKFKKRSQSAAGREKRKCCWKASGLILLGIITLNSKSLADEPVVPLAPDYASKDQASADVTKNLAPTPGAYVQQTAVMDTPSANKSTKQTLSTTTTKAPRVFASDIEHDLSILDSVNVPGWDAAAATGMTSDQNMLLNSEKKQVDEVDGKSSAILIEYGCSDVANRIYKRGQRDCKVHLFRFKTADGAYGAYTTMRTGSSTVIARGQGSSEDDHSISFYSGKFLLILISPNEDDDEAKETLSKLADKIAALIPDKPTEVKTPRMITILPHFERLHGSEKYFMGSKSASHYTTAPFIDTLNLDQSQGAAYADYAYSRPMAERLKLLLTEYQNPSLAQNAFASYSASMASLSKKTVQKGSNELICKMSDTYLMCGVNGPRVYVISGARKAASPNVLARELRFLN